MKMKRFFSSKNKKKKSTSGSDVILETKIKEIDEHHAAQDLSDSYSSNSVAKEVGKKGKKRTHTKKVLKDTSSVDESFLDPGDLENGHSVITSSANVVLRRSSRPDVLLHNGQLARKGDRIPGSESSSRTASSASTHSLTESKWSVPRPWSLVEPTRGQTLAEFAEGRSRYEVDETLQEHNVTAAATTLTRGLTLEEIQPTAKGPRARTFTLDNLFRRFKKPGNSSESKTPSETDSNSGIFGTGTGRSSFRLKTAKVKKSKKKQRDSSEISSQNEPPSTVTDGDPSRGTNASKNDQTPNVVANQYVRTQSNGSSVSADTVVSVTDILDTVKHAPLGKQGTDNVFAKEILESACSEYQNASSERGMDGSDHCPGVVPDVSACTTVGTNVSIVDTNISITHTNPTPLHTNNGKCTLTQSSELPTCTAELKTSSREGDKQVAWLSDTRGPVTLASSMTCLTNPTIESLQASEPSTHTLPRRRSHTSTPVKLNKGSNNNQVMYASSPQLSRASNSATNLPTSPPVSPDNEERIETTDSVVSVGGRAAVDSPIKRAIGYPGVVLRRHQNRRNKKQFVKPSSSEELLSSDIRAKHVMSLNMDDLPTYAETRHRHRRRSVSLFGRDGGSQDSFPHERLSGVEAGRARLRAALLFQRYSTMSTSVDDVNIMKLMLGSQQSLDNLDNMDDDEFLDMYLAPPDTYGAGGDAKGNDQHQEPSSKRVKTLKKSVASFANLISPGKPSRTSKIQRSSSFKESQPAFKPYRPPGRQHSNGVNAGSNPGSGSTPGKRTNSGSVTKNRRSKLWCETFDHQGVEDKELKRQETMFELYQGECDVVDDLRLAKQTYRDSMMTLKMLSEEESTRIFGKLDCLLPLHENLLQHLEAQRNSDGKCDAIGHVFLSWFPTLTPYDEYCANQADAKGTLDSVVEREARVRDFLQRCLESPFSRKLDLWSYLDLPRSRLVKYPLLLKNILKATPPEHPDAIQLEKALAMVNDVITRVDDLTGERQSQLIINKLDFLDEKQRCPELEQSRSVICSGQLKSSRGTKLQVFLFDRVLVLARNVTRHDKSYQVYRQPLALSSAVIEPDEGGRLSGSFRGGILSGDKAKYAFRVRSEDTGFGYTLIAADEHDRKQWVNSITEAAAKCRSRRTSSADSEASNPGRVASERRSPTVPQVVTLQRSSSVKDDRTDATSRYRNRSMTGNPQTLLKDDLRKQEKKRESPLFVRRKRLSPARIVLAASSGKKAGTSGNDACRRSRSLTSSPITLAPPTPKPGSGLSRSESCTAKPPSGRVHHLAQSVSNPHFPTSPKFLPTLSAPELSSVLTNQRLVIIDTPLEEASARITPTIDHAPDAPPSVHVLTPTPGPSTTNSPVVKMNHLFFDSPDHPASSNTSQNFPMDEEDSVSPLFKSLPSSSSAPTLLPSSSHSSGRNTVMPIVGWTIPQPAIDCSKPDIFAEDCDVTLSSSVAEEASIDGDATPTNETVPFFQPYHVTEALCEIIDTVCSRDVTSSDAINLTSDDGLLFRGNTDEMSI